VAPDLAAQGTTRVSPSDSSSESFLQKMQIFYELFPYPDRPIFMRPNPNGSIDAHAGACALLAEYGTHLSADAFQDLKLRDVRHAFSTKKRIALIGCGTDEPLLFRILHPHNDIVGIDLSLRSIRRAQRKLQWHRLRPVEFVHGEAHSALGAGALGVFDHIQCFGVLHHQPNPRDLLSAMSAALNTNGTLRLMIYSRTGRRLERGIQKKYRPLAMSQRAFTLTSLRLFLWRLFLPFFAKKTLSQRFRYIGFSRARIADAFLHPSDHPLSLKDTLRWAEAEGLQLVYHRAKSYERGLICSHANVHSPVQTLIDEEENGNISSNIVLVFKKVGTHTWMSN
jgi:SAM-dependent methyltransferase